jgi:hypothetical protein
MKDTQDGFSKKGREKAHECPIPGRLFLRTGEIEVPKFRLEEP